MTYLNKILVIAMSNLVPKRTGIKGAVIWVSVGEFEGKKGQHGPRIKVAVGAKINSETLGNAASITIEKNPRVIGKDLPKRIENEAIAFVKKNYAVLLKYWNGKLDTGSLIEKIEPL